MTDHIRSREGNWHDIGGPGGGGGGGGAGAPILFSKLFTAAELLELAEPYVIAPATPGVFYAPLVALLVRTGPAFGSLSSSDLQVGVVADPEGYNHVGDNPIVLSGSLNYNYTDGYAFPGSQNTDSQLGNPGFTGGALCIEWDGGDVPDPAPADPTTVAIAVWYVAWTVPV